MKKINAIPFLSVLIILFGVMTLLYTWGDCWNYVDVEKAKVFTTLTIAFWIGAFLFTQKNNFPDDDGYTIALKFRNKASVPVVAEIFTENYPFCASINNYIAISCIVPHGIEFAHALDYIRRNGHCVLSVKIKTLSRTHVDLIDLTRKHHRHDLSHDHRKHGVTPMPKVVKTIECGIDYPAADFIDAWHKVDFRMQPKQEIILSIKMADRISKRLLQKK